MPLKSFAPRVLLMASTALVLAGCSTGGESRFSLLPKSLQKAPATHLTVITEMTADGREVQLPTADNPAYYAIQSIDFHDEGMEYGKDKAMPLPELQDLLTKGMAESHYLLADSSHPASLVMVFVCGSANTIDNRTGVGFSSGNTPAAVPLSAALPNGGGPAPPFTGNADTGLDVPEPPADPMGTNDYATRQNFLVRARLVGGDKFARDLTIALQQQDQYIQYGGGIGTMQPLELFENSDPDRRILVEETMGNRYFVLISAYGRAAQGPRALLWRTKMTTSSEGVAMDAAVPALVRSAEPYFGADMSKAAILAKAP